MNERERFYKNEYNKKIFLIIEIPKSHLKFITLPVKMRDVITCKKRKKLYPTGVPYIFK